MPNRLSAAIPAAALLFVWLLGCIEPTATAENPQAQSQQTPAGTQPAAAPGDAYSWIRGATYNPSYARNCVQIWLDYDSEVIDRELGYAERLRLNAVRIFLSVEAYEHDPEQFLARFENFLALARKHKLVVQPVLFDSVGAAPDLKSYRQQDWLSSPAKQRVKNKAEWSKLETYVKAVVTPHKNDERIVMWDIANEPVGFGREGSGPFTLDAYPDVVAFVNYFLDYTRSLGTTRPLTAGIRLARDVRHVAEKCDVLCYHAYFVPMENDIRHLRSRYSKPIHTNETVGYYAGGFQQVIPVLNSQKVGWFFWELMFGSTQFTRGPKPMQGLINRDGSCRNIKDVAAVMNVPPEQAAKIFKERPYSEKLDVAR